MIVKYSFSLICLLFFLSGSGQSKVDPKFEIYLLLGQSNMAGRGEVTEPFRSAGNPNLLMLDKNNQWVPAKHPMHFDKPAVIGVGPGLAFGLDMVAGSSGSRIGLVPCAVGGSSIDAWRPGAYDSATGTHPYDDAMKRIRAAMQQGVIKGVLWHQGESNSTPDGAAVYMGKLLTLIKQLRDTVHNERLPFVAGELGGFKEQYGLINRVLAELPVKVPYTGLASSKGLVHKGDQTHFDSPSADELGHRYAREMKRLQSGK